MFLCNNIDKPTIIPFYKEQKAQLKRKLTVVEIKSWLSAMSGSTAICFLAPCNSHSELIREFRNKQNESISL